MNLLQPAGLANRNAQLADLLRGSRTALGEATAALVGGLPVISTTLMAVEKALRQVRAGVEDHAGGVEEYASGLLATGNPPGADLPLIAAEVQVNSGIERMAELSRQIADLAHSRLSAPQIPEPLLVLLERMSQECLGLLARVAAALTDVPAGPTGPAGPGRTAGRNGPDGPGKPNAAANTGEPSPATDAAEPNATIDTGGTGGANPDAVGANAASRGLSKATDAGHLEVRRLQRRLITECARVKPDTGLEPVMVATLAGRCYERFAEELASVGWQAERLAGPGASDG